MPRKQITTEEFIERAKAIHGNDRYDYSKTIYTGVHNKVIIICNKHDPPNEFQQDAEHHVNRKCGCSICCGGVKSNCEDFIEKAKNIHGEKYCYDKVHYVNSHTKVEIICPDHFSFFQSPAKHLDSHNCPKCSKSALSTIEKFIEKSKKIHGEKFDYSKSVYTKSANKIIIGCRIHGFFSQVAHDHMLGYGCKLCANESKKSNIEEFITKAKLIHGEKYNYTETQYNGLKSKIKIICNEHGAFYQTAKAHLLGQNCKLCFYKESRLTTKEFIEKAKLIHGNNYNYDSIDYIKSDSKVEIKCIKCNNKSFFQTPNMHLNGGGCLSCCERNCTKSNTQEFIAKAKLVHGIDKFDYSLVNYTNAITPVDIVCKIHAEKPFKQSPHVHLNGAGCYHCNNRYKETTWIKSFNDPNILQNQTIKIDKKLYKPDGLDSKTKTIYEFNGDYWHGNPAIYKPTDMNKTNKKTFGELYAATIQKEQALINAGYNLITIWENEFDNNFSQYQL